LLLLLQLLLMDFLLQLHPFAFSSRFSQLLLLQQLLPAFFLSFVGCTRLFQLLAGCINRRPLSLQLQQQRVRGCSHIECILDWKLLHTLRHNCTNLQALLLHMSTLTLEPFCFCDGCCCSSR
jgi:hypothetical protein